MRKSLSCLAILTLLLVYASDTEAQGGGFMVSAGMSSSGMSDMKYLQEFILSTYPVEARITSSFPPFSSSSVTLFKQYYDYLRVGGSYSYSTTGGKSSYRDYSGEIFTEMTATSHRMGAYMSYVILGGDLLDLALSGRIDANYTSMLIESYYTVYTYGNQITDRYWSISPTGSIGGECMFKIRNFGLGAEAGYQVDLRGNLKESGNGDPLLDPADRERVLSSDWTGWFARLALLINFRQ